MNPAKQGSSSSSSSSSSSPSSSSSSSSGGVSLMRFSSFSLQSTYSQPELTQVLQCMVQADKDNHLNKMKEEKIELTRHHSFGTHRPNKNKNKQPKDILAAKLKEKINSKLRATQSFDCSAVIRQERAFTSCENFMDGVPVRKCRSLVIPSYNLDEMSNKTPSLKRKRKENATENEQPEPKAKKRPKTS